MRVDSGAIYDPDGWRGNDTGFLHRLAKVIALEELVRPLVIFGLEDQDDFVGIRAAACSS
jgi:hypothetical protein